MRIETAYMRGQFAILPAIGIVIGNGEYRCRLSVIWGCWGISVGLGKLARGGILNGKEKQ